MPRLAGVDLPENKRAEVALTYIYGIGQANVKVVLAKADVNPDKRARDFTAQDINRLQKILESYNLEGNLRKQVHENIQRLRRIGAYRGLRHAAGLPVRGQRTRVNARTKRGRRMTVGALKKEAMTKVETAK
ncbi:30S ribosomal protein S13 [Microgenomates group bacterium RBG_16_45_19]|nr:MAG: 30S ribosomal protein S13 [Microgenomates group bacterium RBG_16_45_19]